MPYKTLLDAAREIPRSQRAEFGMGTQIKSTAGRVGSGVRRFAGMAGAKMPGLISGIKKVGAKAMSGIRKVPGMAKGFAKKIKTNYGSKPPSM